MGIDNKLDIEKKKGRQCLTDRQTNKLLYQETYSVSKRYRYTINGISPFICCS